MFLFRRCREFKSQLFRFRFRRDVRLPYVIFNLYVVRSELVHLSWMKAWCYKYAAETGDSVPLGNVLNNLLIITWQNRSLLPSPITEMTLSLPAFSLSVRQRQCAELRRKHRQHVFKEAQWKHVTGFPKYTTVNLKTRRLSSTPQNMTHSADTFLNNDVNTII